MFCRGCGPGVLVARLALQLHVAQAGARARQQQSTAVLLVAQAVRQGTLLRAPLRDLVLMCTRGWVRVRAYVS